MAMTDDEKKPREFWICEIENEVCGSEATLKRIAPEAIPIHVIEKSAFDQVKKELDLAQHALAYRPTSAQYDALQKERDAWKEKWALENMGLISVARERDALKLEIELWDKNTKILKAELEQAKQTINSVTHQTFEKWSEDVALLSKEVLKLKKERDELISRFELKSLSARELMDHRDTLKAEVDRLKKERDELAENFKRFGEESDARMKRIEKERDELHQCGMTLSKDRDRLLNERDALKAQLQEACLVILRMEHAAQDAKAELEQAKKDNLFLQNTNGKKELREENEKLSAALEMVDRKINPLIVDCSDEDIVAHMKHIRAEIERLKKDG